MNGEKFTLMQYSVHAILGLIDAEDFVIPEIQRPFVLYFVKCCLTNRSPNGKRKPKL